MSDLIYMKGMQPVNLDNVDSMEFSENSFAICFYYHKIQISWNFERHEQAAIVYQAILRSKCKNIGETEITAEELKEIGL